MDSPKTATMLLRKWLGQRHTKDHHCRGGSGQALGSCNPRRVWVLVEKGISAREGRPTSLKAQLWLSVWLSLDTSGDLHTARHFRLTPTHTHMVPPLAAELCPIHTGAGPALSKEPRRQPRDSPAVAVLHRSRGRLAVPRQRCVDPRQGAQFPSRGPRWGRETSPWALGDKPGPPLG